MLVRITPEEAGVRREGILRFLNEMKEKHLHMHDMMLLRHGKVFYEASFAPWNQNNLHMLFSLSKSFTSTAVGFAVQDGLLSLTDKLVDFFPEHLPAGPCENMRKITVKHLLTMNTGHSVEPTHRDENWEKAFLRSYVEHEPGTFFLYNTFGTFMLSAIVQKVTGKKLLAYLREKLMDPLGMSPDIWTEESPSGVATGGYGLNVRVEDIAKLGQFYLQRGRWEGKQLLNEQWIMDAQTAWSDNSRNGLDSDWGQGYGYQFWMCIPEHVFRGDGAFGQYCIVMPDQDMVIAINSGVEDMGAVMKSIWENILPGVDAPGGAGAEKIDLPSSFVTAARWEDMGREVSAPVPENEWLGKYVLQPGNGLAETIEIQKDKVLLDGCEMPLCLDKWTPFAWKAKENEGTLEHAIVRVMERAAARAARREDALILHACFVNTPFEVVLKLTFTAHGIRVHSRQNVGFDGTENDVVGYKV